MIKYLKWAHKAKNISYKKYKEKKKSMIDSNTAVSDTDT